MNRFDRINERRLAIHRRWALSGARRVLEAMRKRGVDIRIAGSLARGDFKLHSDIDFLVVSCPPELVYRLEHIVERVLGVDVESERFDVVYLDQVNSDHFREKLLAEAIALEQLPPLPPAPPPLVFPADELAQHSDGIREAAAGEPVILTEGGRPHLVVMSVAEFDRLQGSR